MIKTVADTKAEIDSFTKTPGHAQYIEDVLDPKILKVLVSRALRYLHSIKADAIVVTGVSGMLLGGAISLKGQMPCVVVRKNTEKAHSMYDVEVPDGITPASKIVFIDDLFSTGKTFTRVIGALASIGLKVDTNVIIYASHSPMHWVVDGTDYKIKSVKLSLSEKDLLQIKEPI